MSQNITLLGASYSAVPSVNLPKTGGGTASFVDVTDTTAAASDVASGKYFYTSAGVRTAGTSSGGGGNDFVITVSWNSSTELWEPDCTFAEVQAAYAAGNNIVVDASGASEDATADGEYDSSNSRLRYWVHQYDGDAGIYETPYDFNAYGVTRHSATVHYITPTGSKSITSNGTNIDVAQYATVDVAVTAPSPSLQSKSKSYTPTTSQQSETVTADGGYDGLSSVAITVAAMPSGSVTAPSTITGSSATVSTGTNTLTLSKTVSVTPSVTTAGYVTSGTAGNSSVSLTASVTTQAAQTIHPSTTQQTIASGRYLTGTQTIAPVTTTNLTADNIKSGVTVKVGDASDDDRVASVTGTYSGGGGSSMNVQVAQSTSRATSSTYTSIVSLTCSVAGTYDIYWSCYRSTTSGTTGSQLYVGGNAYGTANTTFTNHIQNNHLTGVTLSKNQTVAVYARSRGSNYYAYVGTLTIKQTA